METLCLMLFLIPVLLLFAAVWLVSAYQRRRKWPYLLLAVLALPLSVYLCFFAIPSLYFAQQSDEIPAELLDKVDFSNVTLDNTLSGDLEFQRSDDGGAYTGYYIPPGGQFRWKVEIQSEGTSYLYNNRYLAEYKGFRYVSMVERDMGESQYRYIVRLQTKDKLVQLEGYFDQKSDDNYEAMYDCLSAILDRTNRA